MRYGQCSDIDYANILTFLGRSNAYVCDLYLCQYFAFQYICFWHLRAFLIVGVTLVYFFELVPLAPHVFVHRLSRSNYTVANIFLNRFIRNLETKARNDRNNDEMKQNQSLDIGDVWVCFGSFGSFRFVLGYVRYFSGVSLVFLSFRFDLC